MQVAVMGVVVEVAAALAVATEEVVEVAVAADTEAAEATGAVWP